MSYKEFRAKTVDDAITVWNTVLHLINWIMK